MPGHVRAADAPEDLWRCQECGWTYPNHHPSAKHRRNHKKQCGRISGLTSTENLTTDAQVVNGSSDDASSDEEHHRSSSEGLQKIGYHQEHPQSPTQEGSFNVEQICDDRSNLLSSKDGEAHLTPSIHEETAMSTRNLNLSHRKNSSDMHNGNDPGRGDARSAHASKGQGTCRHCGWAYPNAHPSAKNRRKHKKTCGVGAQHAEAGGSSDEASSDDGTESNGYAGTPETLNGDSSASRGSPAPESINEVSVLDTDLFKDVEDRATANTAQVLRESDSSNSLVLRDTTRLDGVVGDTEEEKLESGESQVATVDEGNIEPTDEQASGSPDTAVSVPPMEIMTSKHSQKGGEFMNRAVPNGVKPSDQDGTVAHQLPLNTTSEQVDPKKPEPPQRFFAREDGDQSINGLKQGNSGAAQSQSPVMIGTGSLRANVESPELGTKTPQTKFALQASVRGESLHVEERSSPGSPEGLVRSRVQIFEKLAGTSPQYLLKSVSPKTNSGSPGPHVSSRLQNGTPDTNITESDFSKTRKNLQENLRHQQFSEKIAQPTFDAPSELQKAMSHVLHRGNFA